MNTIAKDRDEKTMWGLILLAFIVGGLFHFVHTFTGNDEVDGLFQCVARLVYLLKTRNPCGGSDDFGARHSSLDFDDPIECLVDDPQLAGDAERIKSHHHGNDAVLPRRLITFLFVV